MSNYLTFIKQLDEMENHESEQYIKLESYTINLYNEQCKDSVVNFFNLVMNFTALSFCVLFIAH